MTALVCACLLALVALAAPPAAAPGEAAADWLRVYTQAQPREYWRFTVEVADLVKDAPRVQAAVEKRGGALTTPLANAAYSPSAGTAQLSFRATAKQAALIVNDLKKTGTVSAPQISSEGDKIPLPEIKRKIDQLSRDKREHGAELSRMPAVSALVEAMLSHLVTVQAVAEKAETPAILNIAVQQKGGGKKP
jgi:hypothetical protein